MPVCQSNITDLKLSERSNSVFHGSNRSHTARKHFQGPQRWLSRKINNRSRWASSKCREHKSWRKWVSCHEKVWFQRRWLVQRETSDDWETSSLLRRGPSACKECPSDHTLWKCLQDHQPYNESIDGSQEAQAKASDLTEPFLQETSSWNQVPETNRPGWACLQEPRPHLTSGLECPLRQGPFQVKRIHSSEARQDHHSWGQASSVLRQGPAL